MDLFWIVVMIFLIIIELITYDLTTIWFIASAFIALIVSFFVDNVVIQFGIFTILGIILLILTRPFLNKWLNFKREKTNLDRIIGMKGIVIKDITPNSFGEVKVDGKVWTAMADEDLHINDMVCILEIDSVKLKVKRWEE